MKFLYQTTTLLDENKIIETAKTLLPYVKHLNEVVQKNNYDDLESSINLPSDSTIIPLIEKVKSAKVTPQLKYIIDIGIGGSNLGTKAAYDAFFGAYDAVQPQRFPKMIFLDTNDEEIVYKLTTLIQTLQSKEEVLINAISKSGTTTETIANLEVVLQALQQKFGDANDRLVITSDEGSKLWQSAQQKNITVLPIPKQVGGRYSVLSNVGLFPLIACGINVQAIREGALELREKCLTENVNENPAILSAVILFLQNQQGKNINDNFFFLPQLESLGKWYRQLMGESIGKDGKGITPTVSIGSTDLHSVGQLYFGGPKDKITTFVYAENTKYEASVPNTLQFPLVENINGKKINEIMKAIREGVKIAYKNQGLPYMEIAIDTVNEKPLGEYFQFKMIEMMYLGKLMEVNTFDQPHVELYKVETKKILSST